MKELAEELKNELIDMRNSNGEGANITLAKTLSAVGSFIPLDQLKKLMPEKAQEIETLIRARIDEEFIGHDPSMVDMSAKDKLVERNYNNASFVVQRKEDGSYSLVRSTLLDRADKREFMPFKPEELDTLEFARVAKEAMEKHKSYGKFDGTTTLTADEVEATLAVGIEETAKLEQRRQETKQSMESVTKDVREPEVKGAFATLKSLFTKNSQDKDDKDNIEK